MPHLKASKELRPAAKTRARAETAAATTAANKRKGDKLSPTDQVTQQAKWIVVYSTPYHNASSHAVDTIPPHKESALYSNHYHPTTTAMILLFVIRTTSLP